MMNKVSIDINSFVANVDRTLHQLNQTKEVVSDWSEEDRQWLLEELQKLEQKALHAKAIYKND